MNVLVLIFNQVKTLSVEPLSFMLILSGWIVSGSQLDTSLLIHKICNLELNYSSDICSNLTAEENEEYYYIVKERVAYIQQISLYLGAIPPIIYCLIAGALSDDFGSKPLVVFPLIGNVLKDSLMLVFALFVDTLPLEFFYLDKTNVLFGAYPIYYLGAYGLIAEISKVEDRSYRLVRNDGFERVANIVGGLLSPLIFNSLGIIYNYAIRLGISAVAVVYAIFILKGPTREKRKDGIDMNKCQKYFLKPLTEMFSTIFKKREDYKRILILLQLFTYGLYVLRLHDDILYLYFLTVFKDLGFDETQMAYVVTFISALNTFGFFFIVPIFTNYLKLHDTVVQIIIAITDIISLSLYPFAKQYWQLYLILSIAVIGRCKYSITRSLLSKTLEPNEIGKGFGGVAIVAAIMPFFNASLYQGLFRQTEETFPHSVVMVNISCMVLALFLNIIFFWRRKTMTRQPEEEKPTSAAGFEFYAQYLKTEL